MKRYVRVTAEPTVGGPHRANLYFDLVVDLEGAILGKQLIFACQFDPNDRVRFSRPFVVDQKGRTDFGDGYKDGSEQYGETDVRSRKMTTGALVRIWGTGYDETFRVTQVHTFVAEVERPS